MAGQSIFEIGRRLNWVKEHDLAHGEFGSWLETIRLNQRQAQRFMKIAASLPNTTTWSHLGTRVLYEIATLPEPDRNKEFTTRSGEIKKPDEMTVRELRDLKKQLKAKEEALSNSQQENESLQAENDSMRKQQVQLNQQLATKQQPKEVVKTVTKEVKPNDYDDIKRHITELEKDKKELAKKVDDQQAEINSYKDLQSQDRQAQHWQNRGKISIYKLTSNTRDYMRANTLTTDDKKAIADASEEALTDLNNCLNDLQKMIDDVRELTNGRRIVEGEIIND